MTGVNIDRCRELQKTIVTIEFTTLTLYRVWNFIEIEAFAVLLPKVWHNRWQVPTLTGVKNHRKLLWLMNSAPSNCALCKISWKMVNLIPHSPFKDSPHHIMASTRRNGFHKKECTISDMIWWKWICCQSQGYVFWLIQQLWRLFSPRIS